MSSSNTSSPSSSLLGMTQRRQQQQTINPFNNSIQNNDTNSSHDRSTAVHSTVETSSMTTGSTAGSKSTGSSNIPSSSTTPSSTSSMTTTTSISLTMMRHHTTKGLDKNNSIKKKKFNYSHQKNHYLSQRSLSFWIVLFVILFMILYLSTVIIITITHMKERSQQSQHSSQFITTNNNNDSRMKQQQIVSNHQRKRKNNSKNTIFNQQDITDSRISQENDNVQQEQKVVTTDKDIGKEVQVEDNTLNQKTTTRKKRRNVFKMYDLTMNLTDGVKPNVIIQHTKNNELPIAYKDDTILSVQQHPTPNNIVTAYIENSNIPEWDTTSTSSGTSTSNDIIQSNRSTAQSKLLKKVVYTRVSSCTKLLQQFPIDDTPVDYDTYLPWIHDIFPTHDGKFIQIIAQSKRRCKNGNAEKHILKHMNPQASLFQHISIKRIYNTNTNTTTNTPDTTAATGNSNNSSSVRYQIVSHNDADDDGIATRFICRFKPSMEETLSIYNFDYDWTAYRKRYVASFNEDDAGIKAIHSSQLIFKCPVPPNLQKLIASGKTIINDYSTLFVDIIPIRTPSRWGKPLRYVQPQYKEFQQEPEFLPYTVFGTNHILPPIIDSGRWENLPICKPSLLQYGKSSDTTSSDENENDNEKGNDSIKSLSTDNEENDVTLDDNENNNNQDTDIEQQQVQEQPIITHRLVSCIWASAGYTTRGNRFAINDGQRRLLEWITYNKIIGFDHFYVYDNSGAFSNETSLKPITDLFPADTITYIPWPAQICNNNPNNVDSVGERSSQYAAEQSCRLRFGPHVQWIGQFDIDEYLVPMGSHNTVTDLLDKLDNEGTKIISFASWRAWPRYDYIEPPEPINDSDLCWHNEPCFELHIPTNATMLQAYNCDRQQPGQKATTMPAEKQLYRSDYVLSHFVHYSVATVLSEKNKTEYTKNNKYRWKSRAFPDPRQRFGNEVTEGLMIHTKAVARQDTAGYQRMCHVNNLKLPTRRQGVCRLGIPWPDNIVSSAGADQSNEIAIAAEETIANNKNKRRRTRNKNNVVNTAIETTTKVLGTKDGHAFNCYVNKKVEDYLVPKLKMELSKHTKVLLLQNQNQQEQQQEEEEQDLEEDEQQAEE